MIWLLKQLNHFVRHQLSFQIILDDLFLIYVNDTHSTFSDDELVLYADDATFSTSDYNVIKLQHTLEEKECCLTYLLVDVVLLSLYYAHIHSKLTHSILVWSRLFKMQHRTVRTMCSLAYQRLRYITLLLHLHILNLCKATFK